VAKAGPAFGVAVRSAARRPTKEMTKVALAGKG